MERFCVFAALIECRDLRPFLSLRASTSVSSDGWMLHWCVLIFSALSGERRPEYVLAGKPPGDESLEGRWGPRLLLLLQGALSCA